MRKFYSKILLGFLFTLSLLGTRAQNVNVNPGAGTYPTLQAAFTAINNGVHTGAIIIDIVNNTTEPAAGAILNASASGSASYTSVLIQPSGGAWTISGAATAGVALITFNGADNVTFDGLNSGGNSLTIDNTTASATSGTATLYFVGGATGNTINRCSVKGASSSTVVTNGGTIYFATDAVTTAGNDNNTISNCDIGPSGANLPTKAILGNGSTTTVAIGNSGIVINNNDIHDYFGAAVTSSGIATNGGCNNWSITNNRFYQTATRTWTAGATHRAIELGNSTLTSGAQGMTVTGNIIGYASNTQTGVYTLTGSTGKFQGIVFTGQSSGTVSNINNNTIAAISLSGVTSSGTSTSSPFIGMLISNGVAVTNNNTIGSQSATGSLVFSTTTTTATDVIGIYNFSLDNWACAGNTLGGISVTNAGASGTFVIYGMRANTGTALSWTASSNVIGGSVANSVQLNATGTSSQVIGLHTSNAAAVFTLNTIRNMSINIGTGATTAASMIGINITTATPSHSLQQNTIFNLSNSNTTAASVVSGIQFTGGTANVIQRNLIYDLSAATNSTAAEVNGIRVSGGTSNYRNNIIRLGSNISNAIGTGSVTGGINGINEPLGTNTFYHNSVYISGAPTAGVGPSYAFNSSITVNTRIYRNNIFFNARSNAGATGKNYAVRVGGTAANPAGLTINNNIYFANGSGAVFGYFNAADVANLAAWQTAVGQDVNSLEADPLFVSATDLHINAGSPAIDVAANVSVSNDYFGKSRPGANALYDIGADERDGLAPVNDDIQATAFINPTNGGTKALGVPFSPQASFTNGGLNNQVNITVRYRILNPSAVEVYNQTFVIPSLAASATTTVTFPAVTLTSAGTHTIIARAELVGDATPANDQITGTLNVPAPLSGTYTVGTGGNYTSLTNTGGIFEALNSIGGSGSIIINIISDLNAETGANALNELTGGTTVLLKPSGAARAINGTGATVLIKLFGTDNVTIDGSLSGGTDRSLTLTNNAGGAIIWVGTNTTSGANNNTIKNCVLTGLISTAGQGFIASSGITLGSAAEFPNSNNSILNNSVARVQNAFFSTGNATTLDQNWLLVGNDFGSTVAADKLTFRGMFISNATNFIIRRNNISGVSSGTASTSTMSGIQVAGNINGGLIEANKIKDIRQNNTTGYGSNGIFLAAATTASNVTIANNFISDIVSVGFAGVTFEDNGYGIMVNSGAGYNIYNNSISLSTNQVSATGITAAINIAAAVTTVNGLNIRNNILSNTQTVGTVYAVYDASTAGNTIFSNIDYNNYWATNVGYLTSARVTLADWQAATGKDANSKNTLPNFVNPATDLHLTPSTSCVTTGKGVNIPAVTTDIDLNSRNTVPFIGAHEAYEPATASTVLFNTVPGTANRTYLVNGATDYLKDCQLITTITPSGATPLAGSVLAKVTIDATVQTYLTQPYVQRHYDIEPATGAATATATVTLYFTDQEFVDYNVANTGYFDLPTVAGGGSADPLVARLRVIQYHGTGTVPGTYTGATEVIDPVDANIVYNATLLRWEVTIPVNGFSGFYISSNPVVTPINITYFRGARQNGVHNLDWKVNVTSSPTVTLTLERSADSRSFSAIYNTTATDTRTLQPFTHTDNQPLVGINYYRLKMTDVNGKVYYSGIVALVNGTKGFDLIGIAPNPVVSGNFKLNITSATALRMDLQVSDMQGKVVMTQTANISGGSGSITVTVDRLAAGTYNIYGITPEGKTRLIRFVKN